MTTVIPALDALPPSPLRSDQATFVARTEARLTAEETVYQPQMSAVIVAINTLAGELMAAAAAAAASAGTATTQAIAAAAAAATAGATNWVSGETFGASGTHPGVGDARTSLIDLQTYRRKTTGAGTTDPKNDSTNWERVVLGTGVGGTVAATGSVTLTNTSTAVQVVQATAYGQSVTLPSATLMSASAATFNINNISIYPMRVIDNGGATLGFIPPNSTAHLALCSNTTAAGVWSCLGLDPFAVTAQTSFPAMTNGYNYLSQITIDANRTLLLVHDGTTYGVYGVVYDASSQTWGAATLIRAGAGATTFYKAILSATNQVLVCSCPNGAATFQAVTLTLSGTTITVNTAATATLAGNIDTFADLIAVGSSFALAYGRATSTTAIRALTISGTTVTIGAESTLTGTYPGSPRLHYVNSTTVLAISAVNSSNLYAKPFTVSGSSLTGGTEASITSNSASVYQFRSFAFGTRWGVVFNGSSDYLSAAVISVSGTVATASTVQNILNNAAVSPHDIAIYGTRFTVFAALTTNVHYCNTITDTAGTASAGTAVGFTNWSGLGTIALVRQSGVYATILCNASNNNVALTYDISGASPSLTRSVSAGGTSAMYCAPTTRYGVRHAGLLQSAAASYLFQGGASSEGVTLTDAAMAFNGRRAITLGHGDAATATAVWAYSTIAPLALQRVECIA